MEEPAKPQGEAPRIPQKWYFYNLKQSIDDPYKAFSASVLDSISGTFEYSLLDESRAATPCNDSRAGTPCKDESPVPVAPFCDPKVPLYSQSTMRKTIAPITEWIPFSPSDNLRLSRASPDDAPVAVGHDRLLFQVHRLSSLRPIYWSIPYATKVCSSRWVFSDTLTPVDPHWDDEIFPHFMNFVDNAQTYRETLEKSAEEPALMRVISQRLDLKQGGKDLPVDLLFSPCNSWVYIFKADSSYVCSKQTVQCLLTGTICRGVIAILRPFDFAEYKQLYRLPDRASDDPHYEPLPINNLILVFHGVGQKLSNSYARINFVYAIDKLRVEIQQASDAPEIYNHFPDKSPKSVQTLVLAVSWRSAFKTDENFDIDSITVPSILPIRQAFSDALLDIPLYMSENRRPEMLAAAANEANRLYHLVSKHHPAFAQKGKTHIVGHSLGSLITADLLTHQPTVLNSDTIKAAPFKFQTYNYFTTGSMLGVFMVLKGQTLIPREEFDEECRKSGRSSSKPEDRPFGCFAVRNLYNIIHQSDLLSFLVNATVEGAKDPSVRHLLGKDGLSLEADELPTKLSSGSSGGQNGHSRNGSASDSESDAPSSSPSSSRLSLTRFFSSHFSKAKDETDIDVADPEVVHDADEVPESIAVLMKRFKMLNENGQIDYKIPQPVSYIPSHYLKMFTAHFDYWSNKEIARFLAIECGRLPGEAATVREHRVKWKYRTKQGEQPNSQIA